jgi:methyl-accepting chemotaxis protein
MNGMSVIVLAEEPSIRREEGREKPSAAEVLANQFKELRDKVEQLNNTVKERLPKQTESPFAKVVEAVNSLEPIGRSLKEASDYVSVNLSSITFKEIKNSIDSLNKSIKDMTFTVSGLDVRVKGMSDLLSSVVRNTKELSEDIKSNTALMNMLMKSLEQKSMEREAQLLKNMQTSAELIEKFTLLVRAETVNLPDEEK